LTDLRGAISANDIVTRNIDLCYNPNMFIYLIPFILGWVAGALVNYLADVLPWKRKLTRPFCIHCQVPFPWISYLFWPRRCSACGKTRAWRTWLVEIVYLFSAVLLWRNPSEMLGFWGSLLLLAYFGVVVVIDMEYKLILHPVSIFGAVLGAVIGIYLHGWQTTLLGGAAGYGIMFALYALGAGWLWLMNRRRGQKVDDVALGYGDVNLSGILGLILGWPGIVVGLTLAVLLGGVVSLAYLLVMIVLRKYRLFSAIPYGPFLVAGTVVLIFCRDALQSLFK
jgi:leader peptidase (prepilin peptidase) / N-methyltransferase